MLLRDTSHALLPAYPIDLCWCFKQPLLVDLPATSLSQEEVFRFYGTFTRTCLGFQTAYRCFKVESFVMCRDHGKLEVAGRRYVTEG